MLDIFWETDVAIAMHTVPNNRAFTLFLEMSLFQ